MRIALLLTSGLLLLPAAALQDPAPVGEQEHEATALEHHMEDIEAALKTLRRSVRDAEKAPESLRLLHELQTAILAAKLEAPIKAETLSEDERAAFVAAFREQMVGMLSATCELEVAILHGDVELSRQLHKAIADMEDPGHERFTEGG
jgi:hypothetical protein